MKPFALVFALALAAVGALGLTAHSFAQRMPGAGIHRLAQPQGAAQREMLNVMQQSHLHIMNQSMSGNVDRDFARIMLQHQQATIDAARIELRYGKNAQMRSMAEELIRTRQQDLQRTRTMLGAMP